MSAIRFLLARFTEGSTYAGFAAAAAAAATVFPQYAPQLASAAGVLGAIAGALRDHGPTASA